MKNPILMVGILFMAIFLFQLRDKGFFSKRAESMIPTSCKSVMVRLNKYMNDAWEMKCNGNNLLIETKVDPKVIDPKLKDPKILREKMYKALANSYASISRYSLEESLSRTNIISFRLIHPHLTLNSMSEGQHVANIKNMKEVSNLSRHFQQTIRVQEVTK
ncbi:hypothetical protein [Bacteriovorax sp. Seq25_V]|uniref:hypothetical protein n=1 Tax=Bacteriovorax sp. Seq25_V TaxID=1201288 RepID=UPI0012F982FE|nr:hypothetical protein [Bacteriovorax sp. Seq25_V]